MFCIVCQCVSHLKLYVKDKICPMLSCINNNISINLTSSDLLYLLTLTCKHTDNGISSAQKKIVPRTCAGLINNLYTKYSTRLTEFVMYVSESLSRRRSVLKNLILTTYTYTHSLTYCLRTKIPGTNYWAGEKHF